MNKDDLVAALVKRTRPKTPGKKKSGHKSSHRRKKTQAAKILNAFGLAPLNLPKALAVWGRANAVSSVYLGKDAANGYFGSGTTSLAEMRDGGRRDVVTFLSDPSIGGTMGQKIATLPQIWLAHAQSLLRRRGFNRTVAPVIVTEIQFQAAKAFELNKFIPAPLRRFVRFG